MGPAISPPREGQDSGEGRTHHRDAEVQRKGQRKFAALPGSIGCGLLQITNKLADADDRAWLPDYAGAQGKQILEFLLKRSGATMCSRYSPMDKTVHGRNRHHVYALETTGLLIVAATLLTITLVRYWYAIHWNLR